jgi:hypothetical protein
MRDENGDIAKIEAEIRKKAIKFSTRPIYHHRKSTRFQERNRILAQQFTFVAGICLFLLRF